MPLVAQAFIYLPVIFSNFLTILAEPVHPTGKKASSLRRSARRFWHYMITCWENGFAQTKWRCSMRNQQCKTNPEREKGQSKDGHSEARLNTGKVHRPDRGRERDRRAAGQTVCSRTVYMQLLSNVSVCTYVCARSSCLPWASSVPALQVGFAFLIDTVCSD